MGEEQVKDFLIPVMSGLQLVHDKQIPYCDIKPENIMFRSNGDPALIDFGAAREPIGANGRSITTTVTPGFAFIEQYSSKTKVDPATDICPLATAVYKCLTGQKPDFAHNSAR